MVFDASTFLTLLATSPFDRPLIFPNAARKLGLTGVENCGELAAAVATTLRCGRVDVSSNAFSEMLMRVERAERAVRAIAADSRASTEAEAVDDADVACGWCGRGRLIGEWPDGELAQLGSDVADGAGLALGRGLHRAHFTPDQPMGIGFGPLAIDANLGAEVGEVDGGTAAEEQGIETSMVLHAIEVAGGEQAEGSSGKLPDLRTMPFDEVLARIDAAREAR